MLPPTIPLFPLPNVVLFPSVFLPLHVFEPRYRMMVTDALAGDRMIGMVLLQTGHEAEYEGAPPVYAIGCAGLITHAEKLPDGAFNIILRGLEKFRILGEDRTRAYRVAEVEGLMDDVGEEERAEIRRQRSRLEALLAPPIEYAGADPRMPPAMPDEDLINALAQYLDLEPIERQALLERDGLKSRSAALVELLEMRVLVPRAAWSRPGTH